MRKIAVVLSLLALLAACGLVDGLVGFSGVSDERLCEGLEVLQTKERECEGNPEPFDPTDCDVLQCLRDKRTSACQEPWNRLLECILREHDCRELEGGVEGFCEAEVLAYGSCVGLEAPEHCSDGGCDCDGECDHGEGEGCGDCDDDPTTCAPPPTCTANDVCEQGEHPDCPDCSSLCDGDDYCESGEGLGCAECQATCVDDGLCVYAEGPGCGDCDDGPCDFDTGCSAAERGPWCSDCVGNCVLDESCAADEGTECPDCQ